ncbi:sugar phosphate isomerase/epimerase family protein [Thalassoglobus polymorphus]|uniref:Fructoselysine 3-epimerase n=1 Tax=Thalassoglobus polymorphus TaxID=2527994 RepID=A0A517QMR0_9PLAN|nr:sugar phosphate isomerase/epimerase family protein [Thalassoglobus polymorphus]QDT32918.1 fructoselysine 3-epimerase [Thalassoglobus polymorphus]
MLSSSSLSRRQFVQLAAAASVSGPLLALGAKSEEGYLNGRLYKTLKIGMVQGGKSLEEKFAIAKEAGFDGIELNCPGIDVKEVRAAIKATGLPVDGSVNAGHWSVRHTDPDASVRAKALASLQEALRQTHAVGGNTVLLVVGRGSDGPEEEIWKRSIDNISKALPLASELGIHIAIENVWNQFCYDHEGDHTQTADKFVKYVDEFHSPWVGMQFDIGNHWKYGSMGDWIRQIGKRIVKLDLKGFSREMDKFTKIGEGDLDWADVRKALAEIKYTGWAAAEVKGGDLERLKEVSANMDRVFGLTPKA